MRRIVAVDLLHHVEGRVVHALVVAERERARHRHVGSGERGEHGVLAGHVVRGRQHVAERRPAQHPLVRVVADGVGEVRAAARDQRRVQRPTGRAVDVRGEPRLQTSEIDPRRSLRHAAEITASRAITHWPRVTRPPGVAGLRRAGRRRGGNAATRPTGMSTRKPAAARSSSDSPPQKPYSRCSRAQSRQSTSAGHARAHGTSLRLADGAGLGSLARQERRRAASARGIRRLRSTGAVR